MDYIKIRGARQNNLQNINIDIPKNKLCVITGVSGSGKSSLAFDTVYAEGQRRYVESLSAYARQFLDNFNKPDVDSLEGLSPAVAIEQKTTSNNPRSTVGTVTEIYDYLRLLYARVGVPYSPSTNLPITKQTPLEITQHILKLPEGSKIYLLAPIIRNQKGQYKKEIQGLIKKGYHRIKVNDEVLDIYDVNIPNDNKKRTISVVVDRLIIKPEIEKRLTQSIEVAMQLANGILYVDCLDNEKQMVFSENFTCPVSGFSIEELEPRLFSFNNITGACSECSGLGVKYEISPNLIIRDRTLPIMEAINIKADKMITSMIEYFMSMHNITQDVIVSQIPIDILNNLIEGDGKILGIIPRLKQIQKTTKSMHMKRRLSLLQEEVECSKCKGRRLNNTALQVKIDDLNIHQLCELSLEEFYEWIVNIKDVLSTQQYNIGKIIINELNLRSKFLCSVGLGYLTLSRRAHTLSGGEAQRIKLSSQIGSGLTGVIYVLDEPSIGLHQSDNNKLIDTLKYLRDLGNSLIVVEHDEDTMMESDYIIEIGPAAGEYGGKVMGVGTPEEIMLSDTNTGMYLSGRETISIPESTRVSNEYINISNITRNNLQSVSVNIPIGCLTVLSGVSGSGKSSIMGAIHDSLKFHTADEAFPKNVEKINIPNHIKRVININQDPIGRTPKSNPVTYIKVFDLIRELFSSMPEAKARGYTAGRFSFNVKGGRCEKCEGSGYIKVIMHFLPDTYVMCEDCRGLRYNNDTLEIKVKDKNISDVLNMSVNEAVEFFSSMNLIKYKLACLQEVGLGYIKLGQSSTTLSGGEAQRVKLGRDLAKKYSKEVIYLFDEPTTGLHTSDIKQLLTVINKLVDRGNTVVIIEHNLHVIKIADYIIDIGPQGGKQGGQVVAEGTPKDIAGNDNSLTGAFLRCYFK